MKKQINNKNTKKIILETAKQLFITQGYEKTTIRQIINLANVTTGSLYHFYKNKEDILLSIVDGHFNAITQKSNSLSHDYKEPLLGFSLSAFIIFTVIDEHKTLGELFLAAYNSSVVSGHIVEVASNMTEEWFGAYNPSFSHLEYYHRSIIIRGMYQSLICNHLCNNDIPLLDTIYLLIRTVNQIFNVSHDKIENIITLSKQIMEDNEITILEYSI